VAYPLRKKLLQWLPVALVLVLLSISLTLLNLASYNPQKAGRFGEWQFYLNGFILLALSLVILFNLVRAFHQWRTRQAGSRFTLRLMTGFLILTLLPAMVVALFSMNFIGKRIEHWFSVPIERALDDSVELSQISLAIRHRQHLAELTRLAGTLGESSRTQLTEQLDQFRYEMGAHEVLLLAKDQRMEAMSVEDTSTLIPHFPARELFRALSLHDSYSHLEPVGNDGLYSRVALKVHYDEQLDSGAYKTGILTALFPVSEQERSLAESVEQARGEYKSLSYQRNQIKDAFRLTLLMVMVLTVLFSLWAAFMFSRRLTQPVRTLVEGTLAVAAGDLEKKLPVYARDDFSLLARSFNTMTKRLSDAQQEREQARHQLQQEHDYLNVVLEHLSSGVMTLDESMTVRRVNSAAGTILRQPLQAYVGQTLLELCDTVLALKPFLEAVRPWLLKTAEGEWQTEIALEHREGRQLLVCRGAALPADVRGSLGYVLVFDDVTDLIQAEHDAAWGEVARRLAHEIKNPLTPIQLSAERLAHKLTKELGDDSAQFLKRMTNTIIQQVDNLKSMVNAFSQYARAPAVQLQRADLNALTQEVAELYRVNDQQARIGLNLASGLPALRLDVNRMRQLLVNLIKNALEALEDSPQPRLVTLTTEQNGAGQVVLGVQDNGPGIPPELLPRLFEPYVTSKHKGTGLGLAIVKKIVEEHAGHLGAQNHPGGGAVICVQLPLDSEGHKEKG